MKTSDRVLAAFLFLLVAALMPVDSALAGTSCHKINAKGTGQDLGGGMTQARIFGGGLLNGTTRAQFAIVGGVPPVLDIDGTLTFTANRATVTLDVSGIFNIVTGEFFASGPVVDATGKLEGAVGVLVFDGIQNLVDGSFVETVTGQICVDLAP